MPAKKKLTGKTKMQTSGKKTPGAIRAEREAHVRALGEQLNALLSASRALMVEAGVTFHPDLPPAAFHIAHWLRSFGAAKVSRVAEAVAMDRSATSRLTARLIDLGLVEARPDPADGRGVVLDLTDAGRKSIDLANNRKGDVFRQKIDSWSNADLELFTAFLRRFNDLSHGDTTT
ncbi:MarR family transcriptional regulator [Caballeronia mineralivorans]|uniref:MarR family winged helix-turn-helix transcriptional regulator n=2 Tax=Caballeronia mineralivorans TaxID=2010198 RepID=UPI0023F22FA5|nr:MarR family transcriptional regulator [Caballeronia mineralivorans]